MAQGIVDDLKPEQLDVIRLELIPDVQPASKAFLALASILELVSAIQGSSAIEQMQSLYVETLQGGYRT